MLCSHFQQVWTGLVLLPMKGSRSPLIIYLRQPLQLGALSSCAKYCTKLGNKVREVKNYTVRMKPQALILLHWYCMYVLPMYTWDATSEDQQLLIVKYKALEELCSSVIQY